MIARSRHSLSWQLLRQVLTIYCVITALVTLAQMGIEYLDTREAVRGELVSSEQTFYPALATALWEINGEQLKAIERGIADLPMVSAVRVLDPSGNLLAGTGDIQTAVGGIVHGFKVHYLFDGQDIHLADVTFVSEGDVIFNRVKLGYQMIVASAVIKSAVLVALFVWAFRTRLALPLGKLTRAVGAADLDSLAALKVDLGQAQANELTRLEGAFNRMIQRLDEERRAHDARMIEVNQGLEREVLRRTAELEEANGKLRELSSTDGLTGLANRRRFDQALASEWARAVRNGSPLSLLMLDVDFFKAYNDAFGHQAGDACLMAVAEVLAQCTKRAGDLAARYGGEEFTIIAPGSDMANAMAFAESVRAAIEELDMHHPRTSNGRVTVSIGVATLKPQDMDSPDQILRRADERLYLAKAKGRNIVVGEMRAFGGDHIRSMVDCQ